MSTSKFTSRFRRRSEAEAAKAVAEAPATETALASAPVAGGPGHASAEPIDAKREPLASESVKSEASPVEAEPTSPAAPKQGAAPSRLVEGDKVKLMRMIDLATARSWMGRTKPVQKPAAAAAALLLALGTGYGIGSAGRASPASSPAPARWLETASVDLRATQAQIGQLAAELKAVKGSIDGLKGERDKSRGEIVSKQAQLTERVERAGQENATRIGRLAEQLDRIEKSQRDAVRLAATDKADKDDKPGKGERAEKADRPDKVADKPEKVAVPVPPPKPDVTHTGSIGEGKPLETKPDFDPRKTPLDGYVVRDYDDGYALIETRSGRYIDVAVGYNLPGVGKVSAIERRGRQWVVITPKGYIGER